MVLSQEEVENIGTWKQYDIDLPIKRGSEVEYVDITNIYDRILKALVNNDSFSCKQTQDGGNSNFIEFVCYKKDTIDDNLTALIIFLNLCAPIATYGEITIANKYGRIAFSYPQARELGFIQSSELQLIEEMIVKQLKVSNIKILDFYELDTEIPYGLTIQENLIEGDRLFNYLFQWVD